MKILIIGAEGFVGSSVYELMSNNHELIPIYKHHNIDFSYQNSVHELLEQVKPDVVLNCLTYGLKHSMARDSGDEVAKNIAMFWNFYTANHQFSQYINIGSGAEFDRDTDIDLAQEKNIHLILPKDSYGFAKNFVSRSIQDLNSKFVTLRLFGCFGPKEWSTRLFKRYLACSTEFNLDNDRYFDYISIEDFSLTIEKVIEERIIGTDINCVYEQKLRLSEILDLFCCTNHLVPIHKIHSNSPVNYTGSYDRFKSIAETINLKGLSSSLQSYYEQVRTKNN